MAGEAVVEEQPTEERGNDITSFIFSGALSLRFFTS